MSDLAERELHLSAPDSAPVPGGTATGTFTVTLDGVPVTGTVTLTSTPAPPPPPPPPALGSLAVAPASVIGGQGATGSVQLAAAAAAPVVVSLVSNSSVVIVPVQVTVPLGQMSATFGVQTTSVIAMGTATITASAGGITKTATLSVTVAPAPIPTEVLVTSYGAKGDGVTNDAAAIQAAINAAAPGQVVRFPMGAYQLGTTSLNLTKGVRLQGAGSLSTTLKSTWVHALVPQPSAGNVTGLEFRGLHFYGQPGRYMADNNRGPAIQNLGAVGMVVDDCDFTGTGDCVANMGTSFGVKINNCRAHGWGEVAIFCNGGEQITNCSLLQDDPDLYGNRSSHGLYIHSGAKDVLVQDTVISGARKYGCQLWGQEPGTTIERVTFRRVTFKGCRNGLTIQQGEVTAARAKQVVIDTCQFLGTYEGAALGLKQGDGITVTGCTIDGGFTGMEIGVWAPYSVNFSLTDTRVSGNTIRNCQQYGIWAAATYGGRFIGVSVGPTSFAGNHQDIERSNAPGVSWI